MMEPRNKLNIAKKNKKSEVTTAMKEVNNLHKGIKSEMLT